MTVLSVYLLCASTLVPPRAFATESASPADPCAALVTEICADDAPAVVTDLSGTDEDVLVSTRKISGLFIAHAAEVNQFVDAVKSIPGLELPRDVAYIKTLLTHDLGEGALLRYDPTVSSTRAKKIVASRIWTDARQVFEQKVLDVRRNHILETRIQHHLFPKMKRSVVHVLNELIPDYGSQLAAKVETIAVDVVGHQCPVRLADNARYFEQSPTDRLITLCPGRLIGKHSVLAQAWTVGHELAHATDPFEIAMDFKDAALKAKPKRRLKKSEAELPTAKILSCLRETTGLRATTQKGLTWDLQNDPIREIWADFVGAEAFVQYLKIEYPALTAEQLRPILLNTLRKKACVPRDPIHPSGAVRVTKTLLNHPYVRDLLKCPAPPAADRYCGGAASAQKFEPEGSRAGQARPTRRGLIWFGPGQVHRLSGERIDHSPRVNASRTEERH